MLPDPLLRQVRRLTLKARRSAHELLAGHYESAVRGSGLTFAEVRAYQPGDDVRHFDWNVTARTSTPHVKRFVEERERVIYLVMDVSASLAFRGQRTEDRGRKTEDGGQRTEGRTKRQVAAEVAALLAFAASIQKDRVGLIQFTDRIEQLLPPKKGDRHARRVVHELFSFEPCGKETAIDIALSPLQRRRRAVVVVLSDFRATGWDRMIKVTSKRHDLIAVVVTDPLENQLPNVGRLRLSDAERGGSLVINTSSPKVRREYADRAAIRRKDILTLLRKAGADILEIDTAGDYLRALVRFLRMRSAKR
jgi:uncharacterized protein (DUF58 family)